MRKEKKLLSIMLVLCVMLTMLPMCVLATEEISETEESTTIESENEELQTQEDASTMDVLAPIIELAGTDELAPLAEDVPISGTCGENLTWKIENETLTISGTGELSFVRMPHRPSGWESIKHVIIESGITSIGTYAFSECHSLVSIKIPNSVTSIGDAFTNCVSLSDIEIPGSVTSIGDSAFMGCDSLKKVNFAPDSKLEKIGDYAFAYSALSDIVIPNGVKSIGNYAFEYCTQLRSVTIPKSVKEIGNYAFTHCYELYDVYYGGSEEDWQAIKFGEHNETLEGSQVTIHYTDEINIKKTNVYLRPWIGEKTTNIEVNWGWRLFQEDATQRKNWQDFAVTGLCLSRAVENSEADGKDLLGKLGFEDIDTKNWDYGEWNPATAFGHKCIMLSNGKEQHIFAIVIRGTTDGGDFGADASLAINNGSVFVNNLNTQLEDFIRYKCKLNLRNITKNNSKFFVTGHSLGGAMANIISGQILNKKYGSDNVFTYTFASPKTLRDKSEARDDTQNILNIINQEDGITYIPKALTGFRYGVDKEFHREWYTSTGFYDRFFELTGKEFSSGIFGIGGENAHATDVYMAFLLTQNYITKRNITIVASRCPVDVEIYDSNEQLVAKIKNNSVENISSEKIYIHIDNDEKLMYILDDDRYIIKLTGTDEGTMKYSVQTIDLIESKLIREKVFSNVSLSSGKQMVSYINVEDEKADGTDTSKVQLFVMDEHGIATKEVLPDGKGTEVSFGNSGDTSDGSNGSNNSFNKSNNVTESSSNITFIDKTSSQDKKIPKTGDPGSIIWFLIAGLSMMSCMYIVVCKCKQNREKSAYLQTIINT